MVSYTVLHIISDGTGKVTSFLMISEHSFMCEAVVELINDVEWGDSFKVARYVPAPNVMESFSLAPAIRL